MGRPKLDETAVRRRNFGVRLTDAEAAAVEDEAERRSVPPSTVLRDLALERLEMSGWSRPQQPVELKFDLRFEIRRIGATLAKMAARLTSRRGRRRPDTDSVLAALRETTQVVGRVIAERSADREGWSE